MSKFMYPLHFALDSTNTNLKFESLNFTMRFNVRHHNDADPLRLKHGMYWYLIAFGIDECQS